VHRVIYFEDIQFTLSSSQFWKTDCTVQRFWFREFLLAKRQIPVNLTELLYFALSLCSGTLIVLRPSQPPLPPPLLTPSPVRSSVHSSVHPSVHLSKTFTPGVDNNQRKLFGKLCSHRLVFPNQKVRKIGIVFLTVKYLFIFLLHEPSL